MLVYEVQYSELFGKYLLDPSESELTPPRFKCDINTLVILKTSEHHIAKLTGSCRLIIADTSALEFWRRSITRFLGGRLHCLRGFGLNLYSNLYEPGKIKMIKVRNENAKSSVAPDLRHIRSYRV